jgi:hypothetical protein
MKRIFKKPTKDGELQLDGRTKLGKQVKEVEKTLTIIGKLIHYAGKVVAMPLRLLSKVFVMGAKLVYWQYKLLFLGIKYLARGFILAIGFLASFSVSALKKIWIKIRHKNSDNSKPRSRSTIEDE